MGAVRKQSGLPTPHRIVWWVGGFLLAAVIVFVAVTSAPPGTTSSADPGTIAAGERLYVDNCAVCHGSDLMGTTTGPPFLHVIYAPNHHSDEAFQQAVASGVVPHHWNFGAMAPLSHLTRADVATIVAFVRAEQQAAGITRDPSHP
jgi:mono/diheme cytochrome c family protein